MTTPSRARYGATVTAEIQRSRVNRKRQVQVIFDTDLGYIQCEPDASSIYCEAESAESWPAITALLTADPIAEIHAAGYADPGRGPNSWKDYVLDQAQDADIAAEILTLLHDAYGYGGFRPLRIMTEKAAPIPTRSSRAA